LIDIAERIALLALPPRQPAKASATAVAGRASAEERARADRISWCVEDSLGGLTRAKALAPDERAEAEAGWHARHDAPPARQLARMGETRSKD
jgi:hypothetical protein